MYIFFFILWHVSHPSVILSKKLMEEAMVVIPHNRNPVILRYEKVARDKWFCYWLKESRMTPWFRSDWLNDLIAYGQCQKAIRKQSFALRMLLLFKGMTPTLSECQSSSPGNCICWLAGNPSVSQWYENLASVECDFILLRVKKLCPWKWWTLNLLGDCDCCAFSLNFYRS